MFFFLLEQSVLEVFHKKKDLEWTVRFLHREDGAIEVI